MTGPIVDRRMKRVDEMLSAPPSWDGLLDMFKPAGVARDFEPEERVKRMLAAIWSTSEGRAVLDWIFSLTIDAPYPHVASMKEAAALAAKAHEARAAVGRVILAALAEGNELLNSKEPQP